MMNNFSFKNQIQEIKEIAYVRLMIFKIKKIDDRTYTLESLFEFAKLSFE